MINTRHLMQSAIAAACTVSAVSIARARQREAERLAAEASEAKAAARRRSATEATGAPLTVWFSTAAGACAASVMPEPKLVSRSAAPAMQEVPDVRAA